MFGTKGREKNFRVMSKLRAASREERRPVQLDKAWQIQQQFYCHLKVYLTLHSTLSRAESHFISSFLPLGTVTLCGPKGLSLSSGGVKMVSPAIMTRIKHLLPFVDSIVISASLSFFAKLWNSSTKSPHFVPAGASRVTPPPAARIAEARASATVTRSDRLGGFLETRFCGLFVAILPPLFERSATDVAWVACGTD